MSVVSDSIAREPRVHHEPKPAKVRLVVELRVVPGRLSGPGQLCQSVARALVRASARHEFHGLEHVRGVTVRDESTGIESDSGE